MIVESFKIGEITIPEFSLILGSWRCLLIEGTSIDEIKPYKDYLKSLVSNKEDEVIELMITNPLVWSSMSLKKLAKKYSSDIKKMEVLVEGEMGLSFGTRMNSLGLNQRYLYLYYLFKHKNNWLLFSNVGMDTQGATDFYEVLSKRKKGMTIIELNFKAIDGTRILPLEGNAELMETVK